ncbi:MAG: response regulator transcription factor [Spirosomaceae bacterium]|jgi:DNA-binding NarL/FixJ family response regulator|nr:response regulator transcription factor [Spirosomataceae bacterium]
MSLTPKIRILLVDDHQLFNDGLKSLLSTEPHLEVVGQAYEGKNVLFSVQKLSPQVVFLDINLPDENGIEVAQKITKDFNSVKVILLTMYAEDQMLKEAKKAGVHGYILKNSSKREILKGIEAVLNGEQYFDEKLTKSLIDQSQNDNLSKKYNLTEREKEIIGYVKMGFDSYQIAERMNLSYLTIKTHRRNIHFKLGTTSTPELIRFANENKL